MARPLTILALIATAMLALAVNFKLLSRADTQPIAHAGPALTATSTSPVFTATLDVVPDRQYVLLGETLVVTLSLTISEGCQYPVLSARLTQSGHNVPHFAYIQPITDTVGPGVSMPFTYTLEAIAPGYVTLNGRLDGEKNCGDGWQWIYIYGTSPSIRVEGWPYEARFPFVTAAEQ